jgi:hypothetical protein
LACVLTACSPKKAPSSGDTEARGQETRIEVQAEVESSAGAQSSGNTSLAGATEAIADVWSESVKAQLARIAERLAKPNGIAAEGEPPLFAGQIQMTDPTTWRERELYHGPVIRVTEAGLLDPQIAGTEIEVSPEDFENRIRSLLVLDSALPEHAVHFKLFGIQRDGERLKTRQRLTARGTREGKQVRSLAVVEAAWLTPGVDGPPRLVAFSLGPLVQSELVAAAPAGFEDIAGDLLGSTLAWSEQLRWGMDTWVRRIERSLKPDFLGYHGLAIGDVDGDDREDVYVCQGGGLPNLLLRQEPDGRLLDISASSGTDWLDNSTGALLADLDNDGDADLAVATQRAFLVMENDGEGRFALRTSLPDLGLGYSPTASDYDLDGDLDLLVLRYSADSREIGDFPTPYPLHDARNGGANALLENLGSFRFADVTVERGLGVDNVRFSFAAAWEDFDNDGDLDLYIANDFGPNQLFRNDRGRFADVSEASGTQDWGFGMSATWADYDRDGFMDLYVSNMFSGAGNQIVPQADFSPSMPEATRAKYLKMVRGNTLLRNGGQGRFSDVTEPMAEGFAGWAWGAKFGDFDNDGWEDLYVANGYVSQPDQEDL